MPYQVPLKRPEKPTVLMHLLDITYKPERIEMLKQNLPLVDEDLEKKKITFTMNQWKRGTRLGEIYRSESVTVAPTPLGTRYIPKSSIVRYGYFPDNERREQVEKLVKNFVEETNKSIGSGVVEMIRSHNNMAIGFKVTGAWKEIPCRIRELDGEIYGENIHIDLYGI